MNILTVQHTIGPRLGPDVRLVGPFGVAVASGEHILISDDLGHRVYDLGPDISLNAAARLTPVRILGSTPRLAYTDAAWRGKDGGYVIADTGNHRILWLDSEGAEQRSVSRLGWLRGKLANPRSLVPVPGKGWLVADWGNRCVRLLDWEGGLLRTYGGPRQTEGALEAPIDAIWVEGQGVLVSDHRADRLVWYAPDGALGHIVGGQGDAPGQLKRPGGLALANDRTVWVTEMGNARLQRFNLQGESLGIYRGPASAPLGRPTDLAFASDGRVLVADAEHHTIYVYHAPRGTNRADAATRSSATIR